MILDLREFGSFPARKDLEGDPETFSLASDVIRSVERFRVKLAIQRSGDEYFCQGKVEATVTLECARCLTPYNEEIACDMSFIVCSEAQRAVHREQAIDDEDYVFFQGSEPLADLSGVVGQAIVLAVPMMPLCSEDCRGLCAKCGRNLNENACACSDDGIDERWEALKKFSGNQQQNIQD